MEHVFRGRGVSQRQGVGLSGVALGQALQAGLGDPGRAARLFGRPDPLPLQKAGR